MVKATWWMSLAAMVAVSFQPACTVCTCKVPPVTPGTKFVTVGGCVAADVHGKNHHRDGCFGRFVERLRLRVADGSDVVCCPTVERDLCAPEDFYSTTNHKTHVRNGQRWIEVENQRMDAMVVVRDGRAYCRRLRDLKAGDGASAGHLWGRYFAELVRLARVRLGSAPSDSCRRWSRA